MHWNAFLADATTPAQPAQSASTAPTTSTTPGATPGPSNQPPPPFLGNPLILIVLIGIMMYFMLFRPQQQQRKQLAKLMESLKSGDKVVTSSGIVGVIISVKDKTVTLRSMDAKMEVTKSSVTEILESGDTTPSSQ